MPEEFRETHRGHVRGYFATGRPNAAIGRALELIGLRRDGRPVPLELSIAANHAAEKKLVVAVFRDISERKQHEEELSRAKEYAEEAAARLRTLTSAVQQSPASVVITDLQGSIKYVNPGFTQTTGYAPEEAIGKNPRVLQVRAFIPASSTSKCGRPSRGARCGGAKSAIGRRTANCTGKTPASLRSRTPAACLPISWR